MGCDIHMYVERKVGKTWRRVSEDKGVEHPYSYNEKIAAFQKKSWAVGRNYNLFGILAGVRDRFAPTIAEPRGIPEDVSKGIAAQWKLSADYAHTPSYYTLQELLEAQDKTYNMKCFLNVSQYKLYKKNGKLQYSPEDYYHPPPRTAQIISIERMDRILNLSAFLDENEYFVSLDWALKFRDSDSHFWDKIVPAMQVLSKDLNKVRCVFWFDS